MQREQGGRKRGWFWGRLALLLALCLGGLGGGLAQPRVAGAAPTITEYTNGVPGTRYSIAQPVVGPDGAIWFITDGYPTMALARMSGDGTLTEFPFPSGLRFLRITLTPGSDDDVWTIMSDGDGSARVVRATTAGTFSVYVLPDPAAAPSTDLVRGADGAIWFGAGQKGIGRMTTAGVFTTFALPSGDAVQSIVAGPDGALWFTLSAFQMPGYNAIGRITTAGQITVYPLANPEGFPYTSSDDPKNIVAGTDGALWFHMGDGTGAGIGRITTAGVASSFSIPSTGNSGLMGKLVPGPDGAVWFTRHDAIGRVTSGGAFTEYPVRTESIQGAPEHLTVGPDGALWFSQSSASIGKLTTTGTVTHYPNPGLSLIDGLVSGADGALWFTTVHSDIRRITTAGVVTAFPLPRGFEPGQLVPGPDGALWFGQSGKIGTISVAGAVTEYPAAATLGDGVAGPDGALWFGARGKVLRVTTNGASTEYALAPTLQPRKLRVGPDGAIWFLEWQTRENGGPNQIGRITTGGQLTEYSLPQPPGPEVSDNFVVGPDGALWFTTVPIQGRNAIGRITTSGVITLYPQQDAKRVARSLTVGPDGALWFINQTEFDGSLIGRITTDGQITEYLPTPLGVSMRDLQAGPDGALWFVESSGGAIRLGRITTTGNFSYFPIQTSDQFIALILGPDGAFWFSQAGNQESGKISQITTAGVQTDYPLPAGTRAARDIIVGPDSDLWFVSEPISLLTGSPPKKVGRVHLDVPRFGDVPAGDPAAEAIAQLNQRGIINGCDRIARPPLFCPEETTLRAQMAALIVRAMPGWAGETWPNTFTDKGVVDDELWRRVATLQHYGVAQGYNDCAAVGLTPPCYGPTDAVNRAQAISFVTRAMVAKGYWVDQPTNPALYGGALVGTGHEQDASTYWHYTRAKGGVPDFPEGGSFPVTQDAPRGWFARLLWTALQDSPAVAP